MKKINKVSVGDNLLVEAGKSSRLMAIGNKVIAKNNNPNQDFNNKLSQVETRLKPETKIALEQANNLIDEKVFVILNGFSSAKKNSLFKLRFGVDIDDINDMAIKRVFSLFYLDARKIQHFRLVENLNLQGVLVADHHDK